MLEIPAILLTCVAIFGYKLPLPKTSIDRRLSNNSFAKHNVDNAY